MSQQTIEAHRSKVALITGVSSGIGKATAAMLAQAGYRVFGTSRRLDADGIPEGVRLLCCDVRSDESVNEAVSILVAEAGRIDLLVNNAGIGLLGAAEESSMEQVHHLFSTNLYGMIRMTNASLPIMRQRKSGRIVNVGSILGRVPAPFSAHYAATKHAVEGYSESLDHEVRNLGIRVVVIEPGMTRSSFDQNTERADATISDYDDGRSRVLRWFSDGMKKADAPESVAKTILAVAEAEKPKLRYTSGKGTGRIALLRRFVPSSAFDKSLRQQMTLT